VDVDLVVAVIAAGEVGEQLANSSEKIAPTRPATSLPPGSATTARAITTMIATLRACFMVSV
jgi:hypothetical protein